MRGSESPADPQVVEFGGAGGVIEEKFWRATGDQVGGASRLMSTAAADRAIREWRAKEAQRRADATGRPVPVPSSDRRRRPEGE